MGRELGAVFAGGVAGALARATLVDLFPPEAGAWPWPTFAANLIGAAMLAALLARPGPERPYPSLRAPLLGAGFCGALTTFSTLQLELVLLVEEGAAGLGLTYLAASLLAGLLLVRLVHRAVAPGGPG